MPDDIRVGDQCTTHYASRPGTWLVTELVDGGTIVSIRRDDTETSVYASAVRLAVVCRLKRARRRSRQ